MQEFFFLANVTYLCKMVQMKAKRSPEPRPNRPRTAPEPPPSPTAQRFTTVHDFHNFFIENHYKKQKKT